MSQPHDLFPEREESSSLRSEQDSEFQRALLADRQRESDVKAKFESERQNEDDARAEAELNAALKLSITLVSFSLFLFSSLVQYRKYIFCVGCRGDAGAKARTTSTRAFDWA